MEFPEKILNTIKKYSMLLRQDSVLLGLSGGPDSVCLGFILHKLRNDFNLTLNAVYIDHGLRPDEIEDEKTFCKEFCDNLGIKFFTKAIDVKNYAKDKKLGIQEAARELRYQIFEGLARDINATKIALGHNADDQVETFLMRLLRGSGMSGLSGIPPVRGKIIRPLIEIERKEIEEFLLQNSLLVTRYLSLPFMIDSSNLKKDYFRNWIRLAVMPELKKRNPSLVQSVCRNMNILREEDAYLELIVTKTLMKLISRKNDSTIELFLIPLEPMDKVILRRLLRRSIKETKGLRGIDFVHIEDMIELIKQGKPGDRIYLPKGIRAIKSYSTFVITSAIPRQLKPRTFTPPGELPLEEISSVLTAEISDTLEKSYTGREVAVFDLDSLTLPLEIRSRKVGDYFYPSGFGKRKKLQDFFVDKKVPRDERDSIPIILSGNDIIWVTGYRMDERFKVTSDTKKFLIMKIFKK